MEATTTPQLRKSPPGARPMLIAALAVGALLGLVAGSSFAVNKNCNGGYCAGTEQNDYLFGTNSFDEIVAGSGRDNAIGRGSGDALHGGPDGDYVAGDDGNDTLHCESGNENPAISVPTPTGSHPGFCWGGANGDDVFGGLGADEVASGYGTDHIWGKEDNDAMRADDGYADVVGGDDGTDVCDLGAGDTAFSCEYVY